MKDYINEFCRKKKIKPVYTENKRTILSGGSQNGTPVLRIHKLFKNCPRKTAQAIANYYLDTEKREEYEKQIQTYATKIMGYSGSRVAPMSESFMNAFILNHSFWERDLNPALTEHAIVTLKKKCFKGRQFKKIADGIIKVKDDNMIELDIIVDE